ncbi:MAG: hypothetical protein KF691_13835 [Phycisphaeraceae bacterium]|nr:hypothetical protein [Phycisphaeraceae bacterium]
MNRINQLLAAVFVGVAIAMPACNTNKPADETVGAIDAVGATASATVQSVDRNARTVTLQWEDGAVETYKCGDEVRNFNQIQPGDIVKASVADAVAIWVGPSGSAPTADVGTVMLRAKPGEKPGMMITDTAMISARVLKVDSVNRSITVRGPLGNTRVLRVAPDVNLANVTVGNDMNLRVTKAVALWVEKP